MYGFQICAPAKENVSCGSSALCSVSVCGPRGFLNVKNLMCTVLNIFTSLFSIPYSLLTTSYTLTSSMSVKRDILDCHGLYQ